MDVTSSSLATAETNVRERDVTMRIFPMSHTTAPSVATGHSLKPSDHADPDVMVLSVSASAVTNEEEEGQRKGRQRIHSANHIIVVYSNRFVLVFIVSYLRNISQFSPSHSLCFTHLVVVHDVRDLLIQALYSRRLEVSKSTCYTHLLVAGNYRHIPIHWKKNSILLGGNKEFWRRRVSEVV